MRTLTCIGAAAMFAAARPSPVASQPSAPAAGPVVLLLPASTRSMGLGNAGVAGRDEYAVFYNPALLNATNGFSVSAGSYGSFARVGAVTGGATIGPVTMGFGVQAADFSTPAGEQPPFTPASLSKDGPGDVQSLVAFVAWQSLFKGFRIGVAAKYAEEMAEVDVAPGRSTTTRGSTVLGDVGVSHPLWTGLAGLAVQNIGEGFDVETRHVSVPTSVALGWSAQKAWGQFDYGFHTQVAARQRWVQPAAGFEMGWSWIEGFSVTGRTGVRRTETPAEKPVSVGASFNADRLSIDYGLVFFEGNKNAQRVTVRWR